MQDGADSLQAARDAFGDLNQLQTKLEAYIKYVNGPAAEIPVDGGNDPGGAPRTLTPAEIEAREADFMALRGKSEDAEDKLNEALMSEPSLAEAEQSLGYMMLKRNDLDEAQKHFDHAAQLDPNDALNFYGQGLVAVAQAGNRDAPAGAAAAFEKAVALSADFAPAWYNLAMINSQRNETLPKAVVDAKRAAALSPGIPNYQRQLSALQERLNHPEDARNRTSRDQESASNRPAPSSGNSGGAGGRISPRQPPPPPPGSAPPKDTGLRIERKTETETSPSSTATPSSAPKTAPPSPPPPLFTESAQVYSMVGTITDVNCASAPQVQVTLKSQTIVMKLHAESLEKLLMKAASSVGAMKAPACSSLRGRSARISYLFVSGKPWDAEMQTVEFR